MTDPSDRLWVKICGVRDVDTAARVAELGADAIGLNFYDGSPRHVPDIVTARAIVESLSEDVTAVGVFVNHTAEEIRSVCSAVGLSTIQLHGDEPDTMIGELSSYRVIRAVRTASKIDDEAAGHMSEYARLGRAPDAWLVDARVPGAFGGTGQTVEWTALSPEHRRGWPPLILAGGLTPENVAEAVSLIEPYGVDVASGVESSPGVKDLALVKRFIDACRSLRS